ncbi:DUF732 domain-containing protein [Tsukamurella sp. 8F]|uniref:DUF732 domain-containing protein n=1 Tax=unclassified Tsukamurella TaxID=2633480 RepID=UPI0023B940FD|nr:MULTISPECIES: DUF732 domain-containing protein [unclassified Tsukamurella]MDF0530784.1 DUF732 domain-containing protein [Tsukamurella sp. 8J]MDF0588310.1 DUF732 domain-containing protein [Tsukamurella sp. 8F]
MGSTPTMVRVQSTRRLFAATTLIGAVLLGATACGGSSTVSAPTAPAISGTEDEAPSSGPSTLPATGPDSSTAPSGFPGASVAPQVSSKDKGFIEQVRKQGVTAPDDVIISTVGYVCDTVKANPKSQNLQTFVTALLSAGGTTDDAQAKAVANKFIATAKTSYCDK